MALDPVHKGLYISWRKRRVKKKLCNFFIIIWELINYENIIQERLLEGKRVTERKAGKGRKKTLLGKTKTTSFVLGWVQQSTVM